MPAKANAPKASRHPLWSPTLRAKSVASQAPQPALTLMNVSRLARLRDQSQTVSTAEAATRAASAPVIALMNNRMSRSIERNKALNALMSATARRGNKAMMWPVQAKTPTSQLTDVSILASSLENASLSKTTVQTNAIGKLRATRTS